MFGFFKNSCSDAVEVFEAALAASRNPVLYRDLAVPDTFDGRFDSLLLHLWPVFRTLEGDARFGQLVYDITFKRMELALRETGVGDLGVGKQIRKMMTAFYGRLTTYTNCTTDDMWRDALRRNVYGTITDEAFQVPDGMIAYARKLAVMKPLIDDVRAGRVVYAA